MNINEAGIKLIKRWESLHDDDLSIIGLQPKMCPAGVWTSGYGHSITINGKQLKGVENKDTAYKFALKDESEATALLMLDLTQFEKEILKMNLPLKNENQFSAIVSFCYNLGLTAFANSTLCSIIRHQMPDVIVDDFSGHVADYFRQKGVIETGVYHYNFVRWSSAGGKFLRGLYLRRDDEYKLFKTA